MTPRFCGQAAIKYRIYKSIYYTNLNRLPGRYRGEMKAQYKGYAIREPGGQLLYGVYDTRSDAITRLAGWPTGHYLRKGAYKEWIDGGYKIVKVLVQEI